MAEAETTAEAETAAETEVIAPGVDAGDVDEVEARLSINVEVVAVLGAAEMKISQLLKMGRGAVVQLDRQVGDEIEIYANKQLIARGDVIVVQEKLGVSLTKIFRSTVTRESPDN